MRSTLLFNTAKLGEVSKKCNAKDNYRIGDTVEVEFLAVNPLKASSTDQSTVQVQRFDENSKRWIKFHDVRMSKSMNRCSRFVKVQVSWTIPSTCPKNTKCRMVYNCQYESTMQQKTVA